MILEVSAPSASVEEIAFRFITNFVHHLTLIDTTTSAHRVLWSICWLSHVFPWLRLMGKMRWFKTIATIGNFAPAMTLLWLLVKGQYFSMMSDASQKMLMMMAVYRGLYISCSFKILSSLDILSDCEEAQLKPLAKRLTLLICLWIIRSWYGPFLPDGLTTVASDRIMVQSAIIGCH
jgi:hypothetical protein